MAEEKGAIDVAILREVEKISWHLKQVETKLDAMSETLEEVNVGQDDLLAGQEGASAQLDRIEKEVRATNSVSPELESAVNAVAKQATKIDEMVPDKNVPPSPVDNK